MGLFSGRRKRAVHNLPDRPSEVVVRVVDDMSFPQSGTFKGYKRYRLTTYQEPGVAEGITFFYNTTLKRHYEVKRGTPIRLLIKEISGVYADPYNVMEVYADGHKVGVLYGDHSQYPILFSEPFDKIYVLIEETVGQGPAFDGVEVYLFAHYPGGAPVSVSYVVE